MTLTFRPINRPQTTTCTCSTQAGTCSLVCILSTASNCCSKISEYIKATEPLIRLFVKLRLRQRKRRIFSIIITGVTFLCETAQWDGFTRKLTLSKAQVVNGGQTIRVLHDALKANELQKTVAVPIRVITSQGDKAFSSDVAVNLNNQNRIEPSFLRSNEPRVVQLANALASMGWYLERRESEIQNLTASERAGLEAKVGLHWRQNQFA